MGSATRNCRCRDFSAPPRRRRRLSEDVSLISGSDSIFTHLACATPVVQFPVTILEPSISALVKE